MSKAIRRSALALLLWALGLASAAPEAPEYELRPGSASKAEVGRKAVASLTIVPGPGRHLLEDAPLFVLVKAPPELKVAKRKFRRADAVDPRAEVPRFEIAVVGAKPGRYQLDARVLFYVCSARTCRAVREHLTIPVEIIALSGP